MFLGVCICMYCTSLSHCLYYASLSLTQSCYHDIYIVEKSGYKLQDIFFLLVYKKNQMHCAFFLNSPICIKRLLKG